MYVWHLCVWYICDMTHSYVRHDSFICVTIHTHTHCTRASTPKTDSACMYVWHICVWYMCDMPRLFERYYSCLCNTYVYDVCVDSFICATRLIYMCIHTHTHCTSANTDVYDVCEKWLICMRNINNSWVWPHSYLLHKNYWCLLVFDTLMCVIYGWHDSFVCATWLIHMCGLTHTFCIRASTQSIASACMCVTRLCVRYMCDMAHSYVRHNSFICAT